MSTRIWMTQMIQYVSFSLLKYAMFFFFVFVYVVFCLFADLSIAAGSQYKITFQYHY